VGKPYGPTFTTGDTVGCCIDLANGVVFYTKNGEKLGIALNDTTIHIRYAWDIYPTIGLLSEGEYVRVNFGQTPFTFAMTSYIKVFFLFNPI